MTDKEVWFITGAGAIGLAEQKVADLEEQIDAFSGVSASLALDDTQPNGHRR